MNQSFVAVVTTPWQINSATAAAADESPTIVTRNPHRHRHCKTMTPPALQGSYFPPTIMEGTLPPRLPLQGSLPRRPRSRHHRQCPRQRPVDSDTHGARPGFHDHLSQATDPKLRFLARQAYLHGHLGSHLVSPLRNRLASLSLEPSSPPSFQSSASSQPSTEPTFNSSIKPKS